MGAVPVPDAFALLGPQLRQLVAAEGFAEPTEAQARAVPRILAGQDVLLLAPTGAGKTEAAMLPVLEQLVRRPAKERRGIACVYVTPLRALNRDMHRRLVGWAQQLGLRVEVRHGDTPQSQRRKQALKPPDLLITTPETLQAILPAKVLRRHLAAVRHVVVDEVHQLAKDRRGIQLALALERLAEVATFQRIGLSATVGDPQVVAALFGGPRPLQVVHAAPPKKMEFKVEWPKPNDGDFDLSRELFISPEIASVLTLMRDEIEAHRSTLVFVNSRLNAELLGSRFPMVMEGVGVHHGSLPREVRERMETDFKEGRLKALVATSTLELGIDVGAVEHAFQYQSPRQVASLLQRVGRAGHDLKRTSRGTIVATSADDTVESLAVIRRAERRQLEAPKLHRGALDVLGHQVVGIALDEGGRTTLLHVEKLVPRAWPYDDIGAKLQKVVDYLVFLGYLRVEGRQLVVTRKGRDYYFQNLSTIEDERTYPVIDLATMQPVGILGEEEMVLRARAGYVFVIRGKSWRIQQVSPEGRVYVNQADDPTARIPGWQGQILPVHFEVAQETAQLRAELADQLRGRGVPEVTEELAAKAPANRSALRRVLEVLEAQHKSGAPLPRHDNLVLEGFDHFLVLHAPFGEIVNETLGDIVEELLARKGLVRFWWMDAYRVLFELTTSTKDLDLDALARELLVHDEQATEALVKTFLEDHWPIGLYMKGAAERLGAIPRGLFIPSDDMNAFEVRFKGTVIEDEAWREVFTEHLDIDRARAFFREVHRGERAVLTWKSDRASPLAHPVVRRFVEVPELLSPEADRDQAAERMRQFLQSERVTLLCFGCGDLAHTVVADLPERPLCGKCQSPLLGALSWHGRPVQVALQRWQQGLALPDEEEKELTRTRQRADLVAVYGKKAVMALMVYGVGPQAAAKLLAKMHRDDRDFYRDLYEAKLRYVTTRGFWDKDRNGGASMRGREAVGKPYAYGARDGPSTERRL